MIKLEDPSVDLAVRQAKKQFGRKRPQTDRSDVPSASEAQDSARRTAVVERQPDDQWGPSIAELAGTSSQCP